jgi:hypothetical protein
MHDATRILLESHGSNHVEASCEVGAPATFKAGLAVRKNSSGELSLSSGSLIGISLGKSLSDTSKTSVARSGNMVPIRLAEYLTVAQLTFISKRPGIPISIEFVAGATAGSEVATVTGNDTDGYLISLSMDNVSTKSTTTQCKTALDANADVLALIETQIASGQGSTEVSAFAEDDIDSIAQPVKGALVRVSSTTGVAIPSGGTLTGAVYVSGALYGVEPSTLAIVCRAAYVDMGRGL